MSTSMYPSPTLQGDSSYSFTSEQVVDLTGVSRRKLGYWVQTGVIRPSVEHARGRGAVRLYSFQDLVEVRTAMYVRDLVSLQLIRRIVLNLRARGIEAPLASVRFGVFKEPDAEPFVVMQLPDGEWESVRRPGQLVMEIAVPLAELVKDLEDRIEARRERRGKIGKVERRRGTMGSTPVIAGTRVPTKAVWSLHQNGASTQEILDSYPGLHESDVRAALRVESDRRKQA